MNKEICNKMAIYTDLINLCIDTNIGRSDDEYHCDKIFLKNLENIITNHNHELFTNIHSPDQNMIEKLLEKDGTLLESIYDQTYEMINIAIKNNINAIKYANYHLIDEKIVDECIKKYNDSDEILLLKYIPKILVTDDIIIKLVKINSKNAKYVDNDKYEMIINNCPSSINYLKYSTKKLIIKALNIDPYCTKIICRNEYTNKRRYGKNNRHLEFTRDELKKLSEDNPLLKKSIEYSNIYL